PVPAEPAPILDGEHRAGRPLLRLLQRTGAGGPGPGPSGRRQAAGGLGARARPAVAGVPPAAGGAAGSARRVLRPRLRLPAAAPPSPGHDRPCPVVLRAAPR